MNENENAIFRNCLEYCINQKKTIYTINDFLTCTQSQYGILYNVFQKANSLFDLDKTNSIIQISIKVNLKIFLK
jgi:hypothetical protein